MVGHGTLLWCELRDQPVRHHEARPQTGTNPSADRLTPRAGSEIPGPRRQDCDDPVP
jgi:hypothetical protein